MSAKKKQKKHFFFWLVVKLQIILMLLVIGGIMVYHYGGYAEQIQKIRQEAIKLVRNSDENTFVPSQTSMIYDTDGEVISYIKGEKKSDYVEYRDIPSAFFSAMISIEDKRFYQHNGVDVVALVRSAKAIVESGTLSQGGSTITMQLARNIYLSSEKSWERKIKEIYIAMELEKLYSKNKIMEYYLNNIYFANGYYGIQSASGGYFSCDLGELSLSQIAFLCAIPNSPSFYDPLVNFENTMVRRDRILQNMYEDGKITAEQYETAVHEQIELKPQTETADSQRNNYVDTYVYYCATRALMQSHGFTFREYFASEEDRQEYYEEYDELYADCQKEIFANGYRIYTSIEMDKQVSLQAVVNETLSGYKEVKEDGIYNMQGAAVCIDNETGYVVAIVGGREQDLGIYTLNRAYQSHRQPGSAIKPLIVYTPFFEQGNTPDTVVVDEGIEDGPKAGYYYGAVTTRFAVQKSLNSVAWKLYEQITPEAGLQYLKNMHFSEIDAKDMVTATALGGFTRGTSPLEMAAGFATLQNDGYYREPTCVTKIADADGDIIYTASRSEIKIYGETAARMMTDVLETAIAEGTGKSAYLSNMPCAGKTGTTNDNKDGWFVGYTRYYTTSVWVGCDQPKSVARLQGATYPAAIWKQYMTKIHEGLAPRDFLPYARLSEDFMQEYYPTDQNSESEILKEDEI